ncbi:hypothetical protein L4C44_01395 [Vibrio satsumensis]|uniref:hypothetical protein n=1 Tax=Vibrio TaxID=662 RepID=UPI001B3007FB|nr:hypothetical protein [Vibrio crassostreae]
MGFLKEFSDYLGGGAAILALCTLLWQFWSARNLQKYKNESQSSLKALEHEFSVEMQKRDHSHQISKSTYEMNFDRKVSVYTELLKLKQDYSKFKNENPLADDELESPDIFYNYFIQCKVIIEREKLYISDDLASLYDSWYSVAVKYFKKAGIEGIAVHGLAYTNEENEMNIYDAQQESRWELVHETFPLMDSVFDQIEYDVKIIRKIIEIPISS